MLEDATAAEVTHIRDSQNVLKLSASLGDKVKISPAQVSLERLVGSTTRRQSLIQRRVVLIPRKQVFPVGCGEE